MFTKVRHLLFALVFVLCTWAPWVVQIVEGPDPATDLAVTRPRAGKPDPTDLADLSTFPDRYGAWLDDSFGLRSFLLRLHNRFKLFGLGVAPANNLIAGREGWLFATENLVMENHRGVIPFSTEDLAHWSDALNERRDWLHSQGARYVFFMAPDKQGLFPEKLPRAQVRRGATSRYEQWLPWMREHSDVAIIDLYEPLRRAAGEGHLTYFPLGTHWTIPGAFVGTRAVLGEVARHFPDVTPPRWEDFEKVSTTDHPGDSWGAKLLIEDLLSQPVVGLKRETPLPFERDMAAAAALSQRYDGVNITVTRHEDPSLPTALMFHDSFAPAMMDFLSCHFSRVVYYWSPSFKEEVVRDLQPELVLHERVERFLAYLPPRLSPRQRREAREWRAAGAPEPEAHRAVPEGRFFNSVLGEIRLGGGFRPVVTMAGSALSAKRRGYRSVVVEDGTVFTVTTDGEGLGVRAPDGTRRPAFRIESEDGAHRLARFAGRYRGETLEIVVRCCAGRLVTFADDGRQARALRGEGPRFDVVDQVGVTVLFTDESLVIVTPQGRLEARKIEDPAKGD